MSVFDYKGNPLTREKIRVCCFNVADFCLGNSDIPEGTDELYNKFIDTFRKCHADVYMFSEWDPNWNSNETSEEVFGFLAPYHSTYLRTGSSGDESRGTIGQMNYSSFEIIGEYHEAYPNADQNRYFIDNIVRINGKNVHFICTHLTLYYKTEAMSEIQQILDYINNNNITTYIIGGDMNLGLHGKDDIPQTIENRIAIALEEIELLESLGGKSVQGSGWGLREYSHLFNTVLHSAYYPPQGRGLGPFDNIVVSPDIAINNVEVVLTEASDHDALCVDLVI